MPSPGTVVITGASTGIGRRPPCGSPRAGFDVLAGVRREEDGAALRARGRAHRAGARRRHRRRAGRGPGRSASAAPRWPGWSTTPASRSPGRWRAFRSTRCAASTRSTSSACSPSPRPCSQSIRAGHGRIVNIGSIGGRINTPVRRALQLLEGGRAQPERVAAARAAPVGHPRRARRARRAGHPDLAQGRGGRAARRSPRCPSTCAPSTRARSRRWSPPRARSPPAPARPTTPRRPSSTRSPPSARGRSTPSAAAPRSRARCTACCPARAFDALVARAMRT